MLLAVRCIPRSDNNDLWMLVQVETGWNGFVYVCDGQGSISGTAAAREQVGLLMTTDLYIYKCFSDCKDVHPLAINCGTPHLIACLLPAQQT